MAREILPVGDWVMIGDFAPAAPQQEVGEGTIIHLGPGASQFSLVEGQRVLFRHIAQVKGEVLAGVRVEDILAVVTGEPEPPEPEVTPG